MIPGGGGVGVGGLFILAGLILVMLIIATLWIYSNTERWRSTLPLWAGVCGVLALIWAASFFSAGEVEKRRVGGIRSDIARSAGHLVDGGGWLLTELQPQCPDGSGTGWARQASGRLARDDGRSAVDELASLLTKQGFALIDRGVTSVRPQHPYLIARSRDAGVRVWIATEAASRDRLIIDVEAGCLEWLEYP